MNYWMGRLRLVHWSSLPMCEYSWLEGIPGGNV